MKGSQALSAILAIHHVQASTNLRRGGRSDEVTTAALKSKGLSQGHDSNRGTLEQVRQSQQIYNFQDIFDTSGDGNDRNLQQCDFCGSQGSCGRTTPLGDFFSVTVQDTELPSSWIVSCLHPNRNAPDCYYSPDGEANITSIPMEADFEATIDSCPDECCTWAYPRSKWANLPVSDTVACDGETTCREIAQICHMQSTTIKIFSCPVGTLMYLEGGTGSITMTVESGAQVVAASPSCKQVLNGIECPYSRSAFSMAALVSADDCSCITCDRHGPVKEGTCSSPIPSYLPSEGKCMTTTTNICTGTMSPSNDTAPTFSLTARDNTTISNETLTSERNQDAVNGTESTISPVFNSSQISELNTTNMEDNVNGITNETVDDALVNNVTGITNETVDDTVDSTATLPDLAQAERNEMLDAATSAQTAIKALQTSIEQGTLNSAEKLNLLQAMEDSLVALQAAINTAVAYQPTNPSYCLGVIAVIQSQIPMLNCGITIGCISGADMLQVLRVEKQLVDDIIDSQLP